MSLLIAPYNNAMRIGQGFNSYTQQICIDDAVVIDPSRLDNALTNDGFTMQDLRRSMAGGDAAPAGAREESTRLTLASQPEPQQEEQSTALKMLEDTVLTLENEVEDAEDQNSEATNKKRALLERKKVRLAKARTAGGTAALLNDRSALVKQYSTRGPSQIVTYTSRFVEKLSEVTDDMNISGSLSIKHGTIGGSGRGAFIDSDKFKESDLNFYISVKVINQTINIKDALVYQGLPSVDENNFTDVFGDSFISGFLEGGEFNALVSMKVLNKEKKTDIEAEAKVALSVGPTEISAEANVKIAKQNIANNTETTIQVSWSGGGHIKPMDKPWTIDTLMEVAAKFPDLVATTPQRTYAILTKYDTLRSFMALKPPKLIPIFYENAIIYTNALMDSYMDYKNMYRKLSADMLEVQSGVKKYIPMTETAADTSTLSRIDDERKFSPTYKGVDLAKRACMFQMMKIVKEVDAITKDPSLSAEETRGERFQSSLAFAERIPKVESIQEPPSVPLSGGLIEADKGAKTYPPLCADLGLDSDESQKIKDLVAERPNISEHLRLVKPVGSQNYGDLFCNIDFLKPTFSLIWVSVEIANGVVAALAMKYSNGLVTQLGYSHPGNKRIELNINQRHNEKIIACSVEVGQAVGDKSAERVTALRLYTNRGPDLMGQADDWREAVNQKGSRGGVRFENLKLVHFDPVMEKGHLKGFWGRSMNTTKHSPRAGLYSVAPIWGNAESEDVANTNIAATEQEDSEVRNIPGGVWNSNTVHTWEHPEPHTTGKVHYTAESLDGPVPTIMFGMKSFDTGPTVGFSTYTDYVTNKEFSISVDQWPNSIFYSGQVSWLGVPPNDPHFQTGKLECRGAASRDIKYAKVFQSQPSVLVWITGLDMDGTRGKRVFVYATDVNLEGFKLHVDTWDVSILNWASVSWLAFTEESGCVMGSYDCNLEGKARGDVETGSCKYPAGKFSKPPRVLTAFSRLDINPAIASLNVAPNVRIATDITKGTEEGFDWNIETWGDTVLWSAKAVWLALPSP